MWTCKATRYFLYVHPSAKVRENPDWSTTATCDRSPKPGSASLEDGEKRADNRLMLACERSGIGILVTDMKMDGNPLDYYADRPVSELTAAPLVCIVPGDAERHRIFSLMLMALVHHYWNGNKYGRKGTYPLNEPEPDPILNPYAHADYFGHNIAAIAVDGDGDIIDFEFNHNEIFNSSTEHAESRLVRRIFNLARVYDTLSGNFMRPWRYIEDCRRS